MKLLVVEVDERNVSEVTRRFNARELPSAEQLGRVALSAHRHSDSPEKIGQAIIERIRRKP